MYMKLFLVARLSKENSKNFDIFPCLMTLFSVVQLFDGCRSRVRVPVKYACNRAGFVDRDGEGSTGPSRGEHRLTVYRAHASFDNQMNRRSFSALRVIRLKGKFRQEWF